MAVNRNCGKTLRAEALGIYCKENNDEYRRKTKTAKGQKNQNRKKEVAKKTVLQRKGDRDKEMKIGDR